MNDFAPSNRSLDLARLIGSIALYCASIVALAGTVWLDLAERLSSGLLILTLSLSLLVAICVGRSFARAQAAVPYLDRSTISGRSVGALAFIVLSLISLACAKLIYPRSWPTSVEEAVVALRAEMDVQEEKALAYMAYDDLAKIQDTLGASIRDRFGLNRRNDRLLRKCDPEYQDARSCSVIIISRLWKNVRTELPDAERVPLETLEARMERVRLNSEAFRQVPLKELIAFFDDAIRRQLPREAQVAILYDPALADAPVSASWRAVGTISLRQALAVLTADGQWRVRKTPPDLVIERQ